MQYKNMQHKTMQYRAMRNNVMHDENEQNENERVQDEQSLDMLSCNIRDSDVQNNLVQNSQVESHGAQKSNERDKTQGIKANFPPTPLLPPQHSIKDAIIAMDKNLSRSFEDFVKQQSWPHSTTLSDNLHTFNEIRHHCVSEVFKIIEYPIRKQILTELKTQPDSIKQLIEQSYNGEHIIEFFREREPKTLDNITVNLSEWIAKTTDIQTLDKYGVDALFLSNNCTSMSEKTLNLNEQLLSHYFQSMFALLPNKPITIQTLDPSNQSMFCKQLKAILMASLGYDIALSIPYSQVNQEDINLLIEQVKLSCRRDSIPFNEDISIGCSIHFPFNHEKQSLPLNQFSFISMNLSRDNSAHTHCYADENIATIIRTLMDCYQCPIRLMIATDEHVELIPLLVGLGVRYFDVMPNFITKAKAIIRNIKGEEWAHIANTALYHQESDTKHPFPRQTLLPNG